jgi:uncharacterized protein YjiS (DUF1127 family)
MLRRTIFRLVKSNQPTRHSMGERPMFNFFSTGFKRWNRYNTTKRELDLLTDRELADLGILRSDIPRIARESVNL